MSQKPAAGLRGSLENEAEKDVDTWFSSGMTAAGYLGRVG